MNRRRLLKALGASALGAGLLGCSPAVRAAAPVRPPSEILPLANWWLTLPTGSPDATIIKDLAGYQADPWFVGQADGVRFRADVDGATTAGSMYPRCELRELNPDRTQASWSFGSGTHQMDVTLAVTATPKRKPEVCLAQVHATSADLLIVYFDAKAGGIRWKLDSDPQPVVADYAVGTPLAVRIRVADGRCEVYLDGRSCIDFTSDQDTCYFKTGAYVLSNPSKGDDPAAYGETVVSALAVTHT
ncbi:MAG: polysaccharide lyase family 7 protein [Pseudonocardia sp.]